MSRSTRSSPGDARRALLRGLVLAAAFASGLAFAKKVAASAPPLPPRLTGLFLPPATVRYFENGKPIGDIDDPQFARAFFGIWLDPRTSRADFRRQLLGTP